MGLIAAVVLRTKLAKNQRNTRIAIRESHHWAEGFLKLAPRLVAHSAVHPVVRVGADEVDNVRAGEPLVRAAAIAWAILSQPETEVSHDPAQVRVVRSFSSEDLVELAERRPEVVGVAELGVVAGFGLVVEDHRNRLAKAPNTASEFLHLAIDPRPRLRVCDLSPGDDLTIVSLRLD